MTTSLVSVSAALLMALHGAEADLRPNPPPGDRGKALGVLQIRVEVIKDVNRVYHTRYVHRDALDPKKSFEICRLYLGYWGKHYTKHTGKQPTNEVYARIWNGGPDGWKEKQTRKYWMTRVLPYLNRWPPV